MTANGTRLLITGGNGFTGRHLSLAAEKAGFQVFSLAGDLCDTSAVARQVVGFSPQMVIHLAAISAVTHGDALELYRVNVLGTEILLKALRQLESPPQKVVLASSANVYGNQDKSPIDETCPPQPVNHYAISKLAMEYLAYTYMSELPIVIARPFNYTGPGHDERFVIPKIARHFREREPIIELGNIDVLREFNDVRMVVETYIKLLISGQAGEIYNICSGVPVSLKDVVTKFESLTGHKIRVEVNPAYIRPNEVVTLCGSPKKLRSTVGELAPFSLEATLAGMLA